MTTITSASNDHTVNKILSTNEKNFSVIFLCEETFTKCIMSLGVHDDQFN
jgi:hypothetical protein